VSDWPAAPPADAQADEKGEAVKGVVAAVRAWKASKGLSLNSEIARIEIVGQEASRLISGSEEDIKATLKLGMIEIMENVATKESVSRVKPVHAKLGPTFKKQAKEIAERLGALSGSDVRLSEKGIELTMADGSTVTLSPEFYQVERKVSSDRGELEQIRVGELSVLVYQ
jgi:valyl-tRNA synthetase